MSLDVQIREKIKDARNEIYKDVPFAGIYRPISEAIAITPGIVILLYGHPEITKRFLNKYTTVFFNTENILIYVYDLPDPNSSEMKNALDSKTNLIVLDEMSEDEEVANRLKAFREKRKDKNRIVFVRAAHNSKLERYMKVGCQTTYQSDVFLPFPRRYPRSTVESRIETVGKHITTDMILYLRDTVFPNVYIDRRRLRTFRKIFDYLKKLTGKYLRAPPEFNAYAFEAIMKSFKRYRNKQVPTIHDVIAIAPLVMAPKLLLSGELIRRRLKKAYYYVKRFFEAKGIDIDQLSEEELLSYAEISGFVLIDSLRFAEGIIKYILST